VAPTTLAQPDRSPPGFASVTEKDGTKTDQFGSGAKGILTLYREGHSMLTIIGPDLSNPDELKYVSPSASSGGVGTVTWKRAN